MDIPPSQHLQMFLLFFEQLQVIPQVRLTLFNQSLTNRHSGCLSFFSYKHGTVTVRSRTRVSLPRVLVFLKDLVLEVRMLGGRAGDLWTLESVTLYSGRGQSVNAGLTQMESCLLCCFLFPQGRQSRMQPRATCLDRAVSGHADSPSCLTPFKFIQVTSLNPDFYFNPDVFPENLSSLLLE